MVLDKEALEEGELVDSDVRVGRFRRKRRERRSRSKNSQIPSSRHFRLTCKEGEMFENGAKSINIRRSRKQTSPRYPDDEDEWASAIEKKLKAVLNIKDKQKERGREEENKENKKRCSEDDDNFREVKTSRKHRRAEKWESHDDKKRKEDTQGKPYVQENSYAQEKPGAQGKPSTQGIPSTLGNPSELSSPAAAPGELLPETSAITSASGGGSDAIRQSLNGVGADIDWKDRFLAALDELPVGRSEKKQGPAKRKRRRRIDCESEKVCKFWMLGYCHMGNACQYSHNALPQSQARRCKFYARTGRCDKGERCLFLHEDSPCKFFSVGLPCFAEGKCRFRHAAPAGGSPLLLPPGQPSPAPGTNTDGLLPAVLQPHVYPGQKLFNKGASRERKGLLGDFPGQIQPVKAIPSLFDIVVPSPLSAAFRNLLTKNQDQNPEAAAAGDKPGAVTEGPEHGAVQSLPISSLLPVPSDSVAASADAEEGEVLRPRFYKEVDEGLEGGAGEQRTDSEFRRPAAMISSLGKEQCLESNVSALGDVAEGSGALEEDKTSSSPASGQAADLPSNLPKRQRELYMRILQKQQDNSRVQESPVEPKIVAPKDPEPTETVKRVLDFLGIFGNGNSDDYSSEEELETKVYPEAKPPLQQISLNVGKPSLGLRFPGSPPADIGFTVNNAAAKKACGDDGWRATSAAFSDVDMRSLSPPLGRGQLQMQVPAKASPGDADMRPHAHILRQPFPPSPPASVPASPPAAPPSPPDAAPLPIEYKLRPITIPRPDFTSLKLAAQANQVKRDPRLRKMFHMDLPKTCESGPLRLM